MSFDVVWAKHAEAQLLDIPDWRRAGDLDGAVIRFAMGPAMRAESGYYGIGAPGYVIGVRVNRTARTVLVLHLYATGV
jgi:hypothetical protein